MKDENLKPEAKVTPAAKTAKAATATPAAQPVAPIAPATLLFGLDVPAMPSLLGTPTLQLQSGTPAVVEKKVVEKIVERMKEL